MTSYRKLDNEYAHLFKLKADIMAAIVIQKYVRGLHTRKKAAYDKGLEAKKITLKDIYDLIESDIHKKDDILSNIETLKHDMDELKLNMALIRIEVQNKTENNTSDNFIRFMNSNIQDHQSDNSNESDEDNSYGFNPYEDDSGNDDRFMNHRFLTSRREEEMYSHPEEEMYSHPEEEMYSHPEEEMYSHREEEM